MMRCVGSTALPATAWFHPDIGTREIESLNVAVRVAVNQESDS